MKLKQFLVAAILIALSPYYSVGQSRSSLASRYRRVDAYELRPGVLATAEFDKEGKVCGITVEKRHTSVSGIELGSTLPRPLVEELISELAPTALRGQPINPKLQKLGNSSIFGGMEERLDDYEHVSITVVGDVANDTDPGAKVLLVRWKRKACGASL